MAKTATPARARTRNRSIGRALRLLLALAVVAGVVSHADVASAEGSRDLYPTNLTCAPNASSGTCRAAIMWRNSTLGPAGGNQLRARTLMYVYAQANEVIEMGSTAVGVGAADIVVFDPGVITNPNAQPLPASSFQCSTQRTASGIANQGRITSRTQELAGPRAVTGGGNPTGYIPCAYTAPVTGIYQVAFYGPSGSNSNAAPNALAGDTALTDANDFNAQQNTGSAAWDLTVRANNSSTADITGRVWTYQLYARSEDGNGSPVNFSMYVTTLDGFRYKTDSRGLDPLSFAFYANQIGFLDGDGVSPLYHDVLGNDDFLTVLTGNTNLAPPLYPISYAPLAPETLVALGIPSTPIAPTLGGLTFNGNVVGNTSLVGAGGTFSFTGNVGGVYEIIISRDGVDFDPGNPLNRVLRGVKPAGVNSVTWDGQDNAGNNFPVGPNYAVRASLHAGEYHFPLIDAENSTLGGPTFTLQNAPGGVCPFGNAACTTAFYDDRGYVSNDAGNTPVGTPGSVLCGNNPPATINSNPASGFDSSGSQRAFGGNTSGSSGTSCTGPFGDTKGLDTWTYYPSALQSTTVNIVAAQADVTVTKTSPATVLPNGSLTFTMVVTNNGPAPAANVTLSDPLPGNLASPTTAIPGCSIVAGVLSCALGTLANGASIIVTVTGTAPASGSVANTAAVGTTTTESNSGNNSASSTTNVSPPPDLSITKSDGGASVTPGGTVAYNLTYGNTGAAATGVVLSETVPANSTFNAGASSAGWSCANGAPAGTICTLTVGAVAAGGSGARTFAVTVVNPVAAGVTQLSNTATIADDGTHGVDPTPGNNTGNDTTPINAAPDLTVTKSDGGTSVTPGGTVAYTLGYSNVGNQGATGVVLSEVVPANSTFNAGASSAGWSCANGSPAGTTCTLTIGGVNAGGGGSVTFAVTVPNPVAAGVTQLSNTATIADDGANGADPTPGNNTASDTTPIVAAPDLTVTKSDGGTTTTPGGTVAYTLGYLNVGNQAAAGVVLSEVVPVHSAFNAGASSAGWSCADGAPAGTACTLTVGGVSAGAGGSVTFAVTVVNPVAAGVTQLANTVTVADDGANGADPTPGNNTASDTTPVTAQPDLSVTKSDGGTTTTPGGTVAYTLSYDNAGNQGATGVVLSETVPADSTFNAGASSAGWSCANGAPAGTTCTLTVGGLAAGGAGSRVFAVTVVNPVAAGVTQLSNTVTIADDGANGADPTPGDNTSTDTTPVTAQPDLSVTKSDGGTTTTPGGTVAYTLAYINAGNQGATGVVLSETVPADSTFNAGASSAGWSCANGAPAGTVCTLTIGALAAGGNGSVTFAVTAVNPVAAGVTLLSNTVTVADDGTNGVDPTPGNNTSTDTTPLSAAPDLTVTKSDGGASVLPGGTVAYTLSYSNVGNQGATGVVLSEVVPADSTFNAGASSAGWSCANGAPAGTTCTVSIGAVAAGGSGSRTFAVTAVNPVAAGVAQLSNTVTVADDGTNGVDPTPGNNTSTDTTPLSAAPDLTVTKSDGGASVLPGGTVAYTLSYSNAGNQGATGVVLSEVVPADSTFNAGASSAGWSCANGAPAGTTCTVSIGAVAAGGSGSRTFAVTAVTPFPNGVSQLSNTVTVADDGTNGVDPTPGNNTSTDTTPVEAAPDLSVTKSDGGVSVTPGGTVTYTLGYTNSGSTAASGVVLSETVPGNSTFNAGASSAGWSCANGAPAGTICTLTVGAVAAGGSGSRTFAVTVVNPVAAGVSQLSNTVTVADDGANGADPTPGDNTATDTTPIVAAPDLIALKSDGGATTTPGGTVAYTLGYSNVGNQAAAGVVLSETVPADSTFNAGASSAGWSCADGAPAGTACTLTVGGVSAGGGGSVTFAVTVVNPVAAGVTQLSNTVTVADDGANGADPTPGNNTATDTTPVTAQPDLSVTKSDGGTTTTPGGTVAYTLGYSNVGNQAAAGVVLSETVPANSTFNAGASSAGWSCADGAPAGTACTLTIGALASGAGGSVTFAVTVVNPVAAGVTQVLNGATVVDDGANGADPTPGDNTSTDTTPVTAQPDLSVTKSDGGTTTTPGGTVAYTLSYSNLGNQGATGVVLSETVPVHSTFNAGASTAGWSCANGAPAGTVCTLTIGALAGGANGSVTFAVTVVNPVPAGVTQLANTVTIADDGTNGSDPSPTNNTSTDTTPLDAAPDLSVTKSDGGASVTPGGTVAYTLTYSNAGNQGATGVVLTETVPANSTFVAAASSAGWSCADGAPAGTTCAFVVGAVASGINGTVIFAVRAASPFPAGGTQLANTVTIADDGTNGPDPDPGDDTSTDTTPVPGAAIGDTVWHDLDGDGVQDPGEPGLVGVTVTLLLDGNDDGTYETTVATTATDGTGQYGFGGLAPGKYRVVMTTPAGFAPITAITFDRTIIAGQTVTDADAGFALPSSVSGSVTSDLGNDGAVDPGDPGIAGVTVTLTGTTNTGNPVIATTTTAADGTYTFAGLLPGDYTVTETQPVGWFDGADHVGSLGGTLGPDAVSGIVVASGSTGTGYAFSEIAPSSLAGVVFRDLDNDGVVDGGETGVAGVTVTLTGTDDLGSPVVLTAVTDASGSYQFTSLRPGTYTVTETQPAGLLDGLDGAGTAGGAAGNDSVSGIVLVPGTTATGYQFGELPPASLAGAVFVDADTDGARDPGEPGITGVQVTLTGTDDLGNPVSLSVTTASDGSYTFDGLRPGVYTVTEATQPTAYDDGPDFAGTIGGTVGADAVTGVSVTPGAAGVDYLFSELDGTARIGDEVWDDLDFDGVQDAGEPGIEGVTVTARRDIDGDGSFETVVGTTVTAADGTYHFDGLPAGSYQVEVTPDARLTTSPTSIDTSVVRDEIVDTDDFGLASPVEIDGVVWNDLDSDGVRDPEEPITPNATVTLSRDADGDGVFETVVDTTVSGPDGTFSFTDLPPGTYEVRWAPPAGSTNTTPTVVVVTLPSGDRRTIEYGYVAPEEPGTTTTTAPPATTTTPPSTAAPTPNAATPGQVATGSLPVTGGEVVRLVLLGLLLVVVGAGAVLLGRRRRASA